jgi:8-oxo-dGTP diphosphatase
MSSAGFYWSSRRTRTTGAAVIREIREELSLAMLLGRLFVLDWVPPGLYPNDGAMVVFDGGVLLADHTAKIVLQAEEPRSWAWCDDEDSEATARRVGSTRSSRTSSPR